jgi:hypothetical protein
MKTATATLASVSPYSQSKYHKTPKLDKEQPGDYEQRAWRERMHYDSTRNNEVFIPPMAFKNCIAEAAKYMGEKIPGKRNATYTKHFEAGILVVDPLYLGVTRDEVQGEWLFVPADGRRGGSTRVEKCFSVIPEWSGDVKFLVLDELITQDVFHHHLTEAGKFVGIGRFRPQKNGYFGRFSLAKLTWE